MNKTLKTVIAGVLSLTMVLCSCMTAFAGVIVKVGDKTVTKDTTSPIDVNGSNVTVEFPQDDTFKFGDINVTTKLGIDAYPTDYTERFVTGKTAADIVAGNVKVTDTFNLNTYTVQEHDREGIYNTGLNMEVETVSATINGTIGVSLIDQSCTIKVLTTTWGGVNTVKGDVTAEANFNLEKGKDSTTIKGVDASVKSEVYVGGNVTVNYNRSVDPDNTEKLNDPKITGVTASGGSLVVVEGKIDGDIALPETGKKDHKGVVILDGTEVSTIYAGEVSSEDAAAKVTGFFVGDRTASFIDNFSVVGDKDGSVMKSTDLLDKTATGNTYFVIMNDASNKPSTLTITSNDGRKIDSITGSGVKVINYNSADGSVIIEVPTCGGLQQLEIKFEIIPDPEPDPTPNPTPSLTRVLSVTPLSSSVTSSGYYSADVSNAVAGDWQLDTVVGGWSFLNGGKKITNSWVKAVNPYATGSQPSASWFYFDENGKMLTGWQWITGPDGITRCYYLNPMSGSLLGACLMGGRTPDGYLVDSTGAWIVDGKVQTR